VLAKEELLAMEWQLSGSATVKLMQKTVTLNDGHNFY